MLNVTLDEVKGIVTLIPDEALSENDFVSASNTIDPYIEKAGRINGLIIRIDKFPGWESFGALIKHFSFVKKHHKKVSHVAFVTDSAFGDFAEKVLEHFVSAEVKHFTSDALDEAEKWILNTD